jgi:hypothetical protein
MLWLFDNFYVYSSSLFLFSFFIKEIIQFPNAMQYDQDKISSTVFYFGTKLNLNSLFKQ